jgi:hypothetical protein
LIITTSKSKRVFPQKYIRKNVQKLNMLQDKRKEGVAGKDLR